MFMHRYGWGRESLKRFCQITDMEEFIHKVSIPFQVEWDLTLIILTLLLLKIPCQKSQFSYQNKIFQCLLPKTMTLFYFLISTD